MRYSFDNRAAKPGRAGKLGGQTVSKHAQIRRKRDVRGRGSWRIPRGLIYSGGHPVSVDHGRAHPALGDQRRDGGLRFPRQSKAPSARQPLAGASLRLCGVELRGACGREGRLNGPSASSTNSRAPLDSWCGALSGGIVILRRVSFASFGSFMNSSALRGLTVRIRRPSVSGAPNTEAGFLEKGAFAASLPLVRRHAQLTYCSRRTCVSFWNCIAHLP